MKAKIGAEILGELSAGVKAADIRLKFGIKERVWYQLIRLYRESPSRYEQEALTNALSDGISARNKLAKKKYKEKTYERSKEEEEIQRHQERVWRMNRRAKEHPLPDDGWTTDVSNAPLPPRYGAMDGQSCTLFWSLEKTVAPRQTRHYSENEERDKK